MTDARDRLRDLAAPADDARRSSRLDPKTDALLSVAALVAANGAAESYDCAVDRARRAGASDDEIVDTLVAISPTVGVARVVAASPALARALGLDIDRALERRLDQA
jgi:alkylhydroperoxidase/carboxymuconolactone decarboxylase family protein YurZ